VKTEDQTYPQAVDEHDDIPSPTRDYIVSTSPSPGKRSSRRVGFAPSPLPLRAHEATFLKLRDRSRQRPNAATPVLSARDGNQDDSGGVNEQCGTAAELVQASVAPGTEPSG